MEDRLTNKTLKLTAPGFSHADRRARHGALFALVVALYACGSTQEAPTGMPSNASADEVDWPTAFSADPSQKMTLNQWNALVEEVTNLPGAVVDDTGPMLTSVQVGAPSEPSFYLFTQPAHPAHPAYIKGFPSTSGNETALVLGYAGSQAEFETFVRAFLEQLQRSQ